MMVSWIMRNPTWTRDELILLLDTYFKVDMKRVGQFTPAVIELSVLLNDLQIHPRNSRSSKFRNPAGVHMKLRNLCRFDPAFGRAGLGRGGRLEHVVWEEFASDLQVLRETASAIKSSYKQVFRMSSTLPNVIDEFEDFQEGRVLARLHKLRERSPALAQRKKQETLNRTGTLACEVCGFDFAQFYGDVGEGYAECHHLLPLSASGPVRQTKLCDLAIVCANCHRVLHRTKTSLSISDLRSKVLSQV